MTSQAKRQTQVLNETPQIAKGCPSAAINHLPPSLPVTILCLPTQQGTISLSHLVKPPRLQKQQGTGLLPVVLQYFLLGSSATPQEENGSGFVTL